MNETTATPPFYEGFERGAQPAPATGNSVEYIISRLSESGTTDKETEGILWTTSVENFAAQGVFAYPEIATDLYEAMTASPEKALRLAAVDGLDRLAEISPEASKALLETLMSDADDDVRSAAHHIATQYG